MSKVRNLKVKEMSDKLKVIIIFVTICLIGIGISYFSNTLQKEETPPNLKLLNSHSSPQTGEEWTVSFETEGKADLTITPEDQDTVNDLDFVSLTCNGEEKTKTIQALAGDIISYSNWQCQGQGELTHLVNIARKHTLKFQFGDKLAFAYNNPDSVTDTFSDTNKVSATSSVVVSGGGARLATCGGSGGACSGDGNCCSGLHCQNSVCCAAGQTCCSSDGHCSADSCLATCQKRDNYCDTVTDHYCKYTDSYCDQNFWCSSGSCIDTGVCGYSVYACDGTCRKKRDMYRCNASHNCAYDVGDDTVNCGSTEKCSGGTCGTGPCAAGYCAEYCPPPNDSSCYRPCDYWCNSGSCTLSCHTVACIE